MLFKLPLLHVKELTYLEASTERKEIAEKDGEENHVPIEAVCSFIELLQGRLHVPKLL